MIFVNDLWTLKNIPQWLEHTAANEDGMGFSDIIFPAFLFIVGLSTPYALRNRLARGESKLAVFYHILFRSIALIIMGLFHVNLENYSNTALLPKALWQVLITLGFFLVWLDYPKDKERSRSRIFQWTGICLLIFLATVYAGESGKAGIIWMRTYWWGILGLIGWAYFFCAVIYLLVGPKTWILAGFLIAFILLNSLSHLGWPGFPSFIKELINRVQLGGTADICLVMGGIVTGVLYNEYSSRSKQFAGLLSISAIVLLSFGFISRPAWGISKIHATPSWTTICMAISLVTFLILIFLVDIKGKESWFRLIKAAGTSTLTCYLLPYFHYAILATWPDIRLPLWLRTGGIGIVKSLLYSLIIILIAEFLAKRRIRLKI